MMIDVVIPVHGHVHLLPAALTSLQVQGMPLSVIVVDDGNDPALEDCEAFVDKNVSCIQILRLDENCGISRARNHGLEACKGEVVIFLDADDELQPGALAQLSRVLGERAVDAAFGFVEEFGSSLPPARVAKAFAEPAMLSGSTLMRRSSLLRLGLFDESLRVGEFIDLMAKATRSGWNVVPVEVPVLRRRLHDRNTSWSGHSGDFLRVIRRHLFERVPQKNKSPGS
jgi:glycosyltransferase involved in cell wall biosynthesis